MKIRTALLLFLATLALAACGNKGPLVLPDDTDTEAAYDDAFVEEGAEDVDDAVDDTDAGDPPAADEPQDDGSR